MFSISRLALVALAFACSGQAVATFDLDERVRFLYAPQAVGIGDITQDSLQDLIILSASTSTADTDDLTVFVQQRFDRSLTAYYTIPVYQPTGALKVVDVDYNNFAEALAGTQTGFNLVYWLPAPYLKLSSHQFDSGLPCEHLATADLDSDGYPDVVCQSAADGVVVYLNEGDASAGSFRVAKIQADLGIGGDAISLGDVTGDGYPDLVVVDSDDASRTLVLYPNDGHGTFGAGIAHAAVGAWPYLGLATGDFDADGVQEVATGTVADASPGSIYVYKWNGSGLSRKYVISTSTASAFPIVHDLDRDGDDDLVFAHPNVSSLAWLLQSSKRLQTPEGAVEGIDVGYGLPATDALAAGDLNDDGCTDVAVAGGYTGLIVQYGHGCTRRRAPGDFDGDGISDLLWHNNATGASEYWRSAEFSASIPLTTVNNPHWSIVGTGDFNGDGKADVFWRNGITGAGAIWKSGNFATQQVVTRITNPAWQVAGIGDFDGDGKDDLLWRNMQTGGNAIWRSGSFASQIAVTAITNLAWKVAGIGDFDGDGKDDILWRHATTGANAIWRSGDYRKQMPVVSVTNTAWQVAGVGDFDGDGLADLLWRSSTGANALWPSANSALSMRYDLPVRGSDWHVAAVGDFDGSGKDDILWRQDGTGRSEYWRSSYPTLATSVTPVASGHWQVVK